MKGQILELNFSNLKGHNLTEMDSQVFGGGSDPYMYVVIVVTTSCSKTICDYKRYLCDFQKYSMVTVDPPMLLLTDTMAHSETFAVEGCRSSVIKHDLNPDWKE